jgi:signal transduction histidine kinase
MDGGALLDAVIGLLQLTLAAAVARSLLGFVRSFPWLAALMAYFALRGSARLYGAFYDNGEEAFELATDAVLVVVLVLLIVGMRRTVAGLKLALDEARLRRDEYERALVDYRTLARHRLANPLTAIIGGLQTLRDLADLDRETEVELLDGMEQAARELEAISLDPVAEAPEELLLKPRPELDPPPG